MYILIDIPEDEYNKICSGNFDTDGYFKMNLKEAFRNAISLDKIRESAEDGITFNNLCNSCSNIGCEFQSGIVRTKCVFYMPPHIEPDSCGNYVVMHQQS